VSTTTLIVGCGYLGSRVGERLLHRGDRVIGTVRSRARADLLRSQGIEPIIADVLEPASLASLPVADRAFYCVGFDRAAGVSMTTVYLEGLRNVLARLAGRVGRLGYASSTGVYGQADGEWVDEESPTFPAHESGRVVLDAEGVLRDVAASQGLPVVILRFAGLYGPGRIPRRASLERGEPIVGEPDRPLNLIQVEDAAEAAVAALDRGQPGRIYLVSDDRPMARREYYALAARLLGAPAPRFVSPEPGSPESLREESAKRVSNRRMHAELGVSLAYPDITTGLAAALGADSKTPRS
jgi:nucleoside-diphosphate-sugar epimerase